MRRRSFLQGTAGLLAALWTGGAFRGAPGLPGPVLDPNPALVGSPRGIPWIAPRTVAAANRSFVKLNRSMEAATIDLEAFIRRDLGRNFAKAIDDFHAAPPRNLGTTQGKTGENP